MNADQAVSSKTGSTQAPIPAVVYISGANRGTTERLSGETMRIDPDPRSGILLVPADGSPNTEHYATLHPSADTYELAVAPGKTAWVNGEKADNRVLESGDLLEFGGGGVLRFRLYRPGTKNVYKSLGEALADCVDCVRHEPHKSLPRRTGLLLNRMVRELTTQTSIPVRVLVFSLFSTLIAALALTTVLLYRQSFDLEARLAEEQARVSGLNKLIERVQKESLDRQELAELHSTATVERLEQLEARAIDAGEVIAAAAQSTVFIQGSFGFEDPESGKPLRFMIGPTGLPLLTPRGHPAVTLEGDGPEFEIQYTGTAFIVGPGGRLLTNRHVVVPWENDPEYESILALGLKPLTRRLIGYLPGIEDPFDVTVAAASDDADVAVLNCSGITGLRPPLTLRETAPTPGDEVIVLGYPTGIRALLARSGRKFVEELSNQKDIDFWTVANRLSAAGHISPLASRGIVGQVTADAIVYDAETTRGGSGGPVLGINGEVVAINAAILPEFGGSNIGVPVRHAKNLIDQAGTGT